MKNTRIKLQLIACLLIIASLAGCAGGTARDGGGEAGVSDGNSGAVQHDGAEGDNDNGNGTGERNVNEGSGAISVVAVNAGELLEPRYGEKNSTAATIARGANEFAFRLSAALAAENGTGNFICSPFSVWLPLAALVNATNNQYKASLLEALSAAGVSEDDINSAASRMLYDLTQQRTREYESELQPYYDPLKIVNAVFVSTGVTFKRDFAQTFMDCYRGSAINVDFGSDEAASAVNQWASDNTEGLITDIIQEFDPQTVAVMANAIYFSDRWSWEFDPEQTVEDVFYSPDGESEAFYMLREGDNLVYYEDARVQAITLWFKTGGSMCIILPKDNDATGLLTSMTNAYFREIKNDAIFATGKLLLPRFSFESGVMQLDDALKLLGVPLFDEKAAPLTGGLIEEDVPVWLSGALQKAVIEVDEKGTTAAAVTIMPAAGAGMPIPTEPFEMNCNRPFVFVLCSRTYDGGEQVLFTGAVNKP